MSSRVPAVDDTGLRGSAQSGGEWPLKEGAR